VRQGWRHGALNKKTAADDVLLSAADDFVLFSRKQGESRGTVLLLSLRFELSLISNNTVHL